MWQHSPLQLLWNNSFICVLPQFWCQGPENPPWALLHCRLGPPEPQALLLFHLLSTVCCRNWKCWQGESHTASFFPWLRCCGTSFQQETTKAKLRLSLGRDHKWLWLNSECSSLSGTKQDLLRDNSPDCSFNLTGQTSHCFQFEKSNLDFQGSELLTHAASYSR